MHDINHDTFYNWISRMKKHGITLPESGRRGKQVSSHVQEVVKLELIPGEKTVPANTTLPCNAYAATNDVAFKVKCL